MAGASLSGGEEIRGATVMGKRFLFYLLAGLLVLSISGESWAASKEELPKVGPVKLNAHPSSLEGKTVVLRWNGKYNGDKFLLRVGELLTQQVKGVKVVRLWEMDKETAAISKNGAMSEEVAGKIAKLKADLVIASQAD
jgi:hypothetical protein